MSKNSFFSDISLWAKEANEEVAKETAQVARTIFTMVVNRSPILTGKFVKNWIVSPVDVPYSVVGTSDWDTKIAEINSLITNDYFLKHDRVFLVNNLVYTQNVEYTGWAKTIAYAPVQKTLTKIGNGFAPVGQTLGAIMGGV